jgi:alkanesulfonate monooxygenase SsuD/methylene tetrahydromethanopterin reductase-like flavin-dependent oxidoreductase (luciferase family)
MTMGDFQLVARTADELGFDSMSIREHILMPVEMVELMGPFWSHAMTAMAFVGGATQRLIVDSSVIVLPYHNPVVPRQGRRHDSLY